MPQPLIQKWANIPYGWIRKHPKPAPLYFHAKSPLLMIIAGSPGIFQAMMSQLMATLQFVRTYLDDLLCITKESLTDHINKLKRVLIRL